MFIGGIFFALITRTWATSLSIALMITICHSNQLACRYSWIYHIYGWIMPICVSLIIYFYSSIKQSKEISIIGIEKFGKFQIILSISLLCLCILINTINLLRIARRTYRLKHDNHSNSGIIEGEPLIYNEEDETVMKSIPQEIKPLETDTQLFRHGILIALLTIDAVIVCLFVKYT